VVRDGLKPGDRVIVNGLMSARPGAVVTPAAAPVAAEPTPDAPGAKN
jgi:hypothetical protein